MPREYDEPIQSVVIDVLEQMAFIFADAADMAELPEECSDAIAVRMAFSGASQGLLTFIAGPEICLEIAENLVDDHETSEIGQLALMELTNIICGQLLTTIAGETPVFDLQPPQLLSMDQQLWNQSRNDPDAVALLSDECPLIVQFQYSQAA